LKVIYNDKLMAYMTLFEKITRALLKDCIIDQNDNPVFIVQPTQISRAIGKGGSNVKRLSTMLNRKIKIVEFNPEITQFVRNLFAPLEVKDVAEENGVVTVFGGDTKTRGMMIGRESSNLKVIEGIVKRYFKIEKLMVK
jgi:N utilization substance protein A